MARILYFDCAGGASGDMILASLVDCGVPVSYLNRRLRRLGIPGLSVSATTEKRGGIACRRVAVRWKTPQSYRHLHEILTILKRGSLGSAVYTWCEAALGRLASAEAKAHGIPVRKVHFHEIGAADTVADVAGVCLALEYLKAERFFFGTLTEGRGMIKTAHGRFPVPAPRPRT